jgi:hypothetical protein
VPQATLAAALLHKLSCENHLLARRSPVICLTDLNDFWLFIWQQQKRLCHFVPADRKFAVGVCRHIISNQGMPEECPAFHKLPEETCTPSWAESSISDGMDQSDGTAEPGVVSEDVWSDSADDNAMNDFEGVVAQEELERLRYVQNVLEVRATLAESGITPPRLSADLSSCL